MNGDKIVDENHVGWEPQQDWYNDRQRSAVADRDSTYTCLVESSKQVRIRTVVQLMLCIMVHFPFFKEGKQARKDSPLVLLTSV